MIHICIIYYNNILIEYYFCITYLRKVKATYVYLISDKNS